MPGGIMPAESPIDQLLNQLEWEVLPEIEDQAGELYATHIGTLQLMGLELRCYRLNNGQAVFDADDIARFFKN
jgi:hypothetical protein